jgi:metal-responsive CopG/Arc/MetJ family transcriptional regulator
MNTDTVRLNIALPKELVSALNKYAEPRKRSHCIAEAVRRYIREKEKEDLEKALEDGYRATAKESSALASEFEAADLERWNSKTSLSLI